MFYITILHDKPHNLHIICDSCNLPIFDGNIDNGIHQLRMIHTHCISCCNEIEKLNKDLTKSLNKQKHVLAKLIDTTYEKIAKSKEEKKEPFTLEEKIMVLKYILEGYENEAKI